MTGIVGAIGSALATLPALAGVAGLGIGTALIGGAVAGVIAGSPKLKAQLKGIGTDAQTMFTDAAKPLIPAISAVLGQVPALLKTIGPQLTGVFKTIAPQIQGIFSGLKPIITGVLGIMQAAAPAFGPVIEGLEKLVSGILPGLTAIIKATVPFAQQFAGILGTIGKNLGQMFANLAPAIGPSMQVLKAFLDLISGLLPVIGSIAAAFAKALGPVFTQFAGALKALTPFLITVGKVFASLASAVLGDLAGAFGALATLLKDIAPSLNQFAGAMGQVFTTLENSGVFAILGDALESLTKPLANLINALLKGLLPVIPAVLRVVTDLINGGITVLARVLGDLANVITWLVTKFPALVPIILGVIGAIKAWTIAQGILNAVMDANPIGLIITAIAALAVAAYELVTHWSTIWGAIKSVASDVGSFLDNLFHNTIVQDILDIWTAGLLPLAEHWSTVWGDIQSVAEAFWSWLSTTFGTDIANFFTKTIPGWWDDCVAGAKTFVSDAESAITAVWTWLSGTFGTDVDTFFTKTIPGWWTDCVTAAGTFATDVENAILAVWNWLSGTFGTDISNFFTVTLPGYWTDFYNAVVSTGATIEHWFSDFGSTIEGYFSGAATWLEKAGEDVINGFWTGLKDIWSSVTSWFGGLAKDILKALGINSPPQWAIDAGKDILEGIIKGAASKIPGLSGLLSAIGVGGGGGSGSGGVSAGAYAGQGGSNAANIALADKMAKAAGYTPAMIADLNNIIMAESGGSSTIVNSSSGAAGIAQNINGFGPGYESGNAAQQIAWMLNYLAGSHSWGTGVAAAWANEQANHWYGQGGLITEPITGVGVSGQVYKFGERGPEWVTPANRSSGVPGQAGGGLGDKLDRLCALMEQQIAVTGSLPHGITGGIGGALAGAAQSASLRTRYPRGGS